MVSPYVLGGVGWYRHSLTSGAGNSGALGASGASGASGATTTTIREMGYHAGLGAEIRLGERMAIHGDYRYNHIRFGASSDAAATVTATRETPSSSIGATAVSAISLVPKLSAIQESLKLSSQGSMWNWGLTFFF